MAMGGRPEGDQQQRGSGTGKKKRMGGREKERKECRPVRERVSDRGPIGLFVK